MTVIRSAAVMLLANVVQTACTIATLHFFSTLLNDEDFAAYLVANAAGVVVGPFIYLGMGDSILFYVGQVSNIPAQAMQRLLITLVFLAAIALCFLTMTTLFSNQVSLILFGSSKHGALSIAIIALLLARYFNESLARYLLASKRTVKPAILQACAVGILPLVVASVGTPPNVAWLVAEIAIGTILVGIPFFVHEFLHAPWPKTRILDLARLREMLKYGIPRIFGHLGISAILSAPTVFAAWTHSSNAEIIVLGSSLAVLRMLMVSNRIMTMVFLPRLAWLQNNRPQQIATAVQKLVSCGLAAGMAVSLALLVFGDQLLSLYLSRPISAPEVTTWIWLATVPFCLDAVIRPVVDALHVNAYNSLNIALAAAALVLIALIMSPHLSATSALAAGVLGSLMILILLGLRTAKRLTQTRLFEQWNSSSFKTMFYGALLLGLTASVLQKQGPGTLLTITTMAICSSAYVALVGWRVRHALKEL